ncbi:hypothetical protein DDD_1822 [Nonlabens dokdonensis DSW-6]|uniref:Uncharacterized protein n=1 Tax=Nonlabens dokdonensis (strain DSM 17205 / KCTC 12402 / DSW-6) TaxID=592029 RepID=L7WA00_NONDD|nr:hypothetical protein DDD_1822 [Nonlabens dokdonensis DSW-6]
MITKRDIMFSLSRKRKLKKAPRLIKTEVLSIQKNFFISIR